MAATMQASTLEPSALNDAPALIESVYPAQKVSFEAQKERKANLGQTLTGLGSYWKGRKPLILVRSIVLGCLLPPTEDRQADLAIYEALMGFDQEGLARRALIKNDLKPCDFAARITLDNPWDYFSHNVAEDDPRFDEVAGWRFPVDADAEGIRLRWQRGISEDDKLALYRRAIATFDTYEARATLCKRPEELDQDWLYAPVWPAVNHHYMHLGIHAHSFPELVEQLGILRYGHRPRVGDTFCGGGSIPFEAARLGCDAYASDLNPIACMLTWGALNIIGASPERRAEIEAEQRRVAAAVDEEITELGIEHDAEGNRAKAYLYCLETRCPETGWMVPMSPSWVISKTRNVVARLVPDPAQKRFTIEVHSGVSRAEMKTAEQGTVQSGALVYELDGTTYRTPIKTLRGDYRATDGRTGNRLRLWDKQDFKPRPDDIFQERLYAIQWIRKASLDKKRQETFFAAPTQDDLERERKVEQIVAEHLAAWQTQGLVPDMAIEPGDKTDEPIRTRGWTHWHHLFNARQLLLLSRYFQHRSAAEDIFNAKSLDWNSRIANWMNHWDKSNNVFYNQALNTFYNYGIRCFSSHEAGRSFGFAHCKVPTTVQTVRCVNASEVETCADLWVTDPPYADAVMYDEIYEYFIAWLRKNPPKPFDEWVWDSRRALAIKGSGDSFRHGMVEAYSAMAEHMPDNGMQCVMFTHQDTGVWSDLIGIFWAAGLQVVAAWYIATETTSELKKGGYVQGTVTLMLRKRAAGERAGFKQRLLPEVRAEVERQIQSMMNLNDTVEASHGEPVFNDSDLQMAGYAAALKVLTAYTKVGGEDVTGFALRPRKKGEVTVVDEIVQQAATTASNLLVPEGLPAELWRKLTGIERFWCRMLDMETTGAHKLDNYQNFAKAFRVTDYTQVMGDMRPNHARLKHVAEYASRDLTDSTELGATHLGRLIMALQQLLADTEPQIIVDQLRHEMPDFLEARPVLVDLLDFIAHKSTQDDVRQVAETLAARLKNLRLGD